MTIHDIDYKRGKAHFADGGSLRDVIERCLIDDGDDERALSFALGFADGALDALRKLAEHAP